MTWLSPAAASAEELVHPRVELLCVPEERPQHAGVVRTGGREGEPVGERGVQPEAVPGLRHRGGAQGGRPRRGERDPPAGLHPSGRDLPRRRGRRLGGGAGRPVLAGDPAGTWSRILAEREPLYREVADLVVETTGLRARELAWRIVEEIRPLSKE